MTRLSMHKCVYKRQIVIYKNLVVYGQVFEKYYIDERKETYKDNSKVWTLPVNQATVVYIANINIDTDKNDLREKNYRATLSEIGYTSAIKRYTREE